MIHTRKCIVVCLRKDRMWTICRLQSCSRNTYFGSLRHSRILFHRRGNLRKGCNACIHTQTLGIHMERYTLCRVDLDLDSTNRNCRSQHLLGNPSYRMIWLLGKSETGCRRLHNHSFPLYNVQSCNLSNLMVRKVPRCSRNSLHIRNSELRNCCSYS